MASLMQSIIDKQRPKVSKYTQELLEQAKNKFGENSQEYRGIFNQYFLIPETNSQSNNLKHFYANTQDNYAGGLERMYKRVAVLDLISACASECSYCVRGYYSRFAMTEKKILDLCTEISLDPHLREIVITGGDPFVASRKLKFLISELSNRAPNIKFIRIGTRLPVQDPYLFDQSFFKFFENVGHSKKIEIACQINHPFELQQPTIEIFNRLISAGVNIYSQNVLLKGVNDNEKTLIELYDHLRYLQITPHYLFHAVPLKGTDKFRTSVQKGIDLIRMLTSSGVLSGRAKPQYALITDIGKVNIYHGTLNSFKDKHWIIDTFYKLEDRLKWNPIYKLPETAYTRENGHLSVKYLDGSDD